VTANEPTIWVLFLGATCVAFATAGCLAELDDVPTTSFACTDDAPAADGALQCPVTHRCADLQCTSRFACSAADGDKPACAPCGEALFPYPGECQIMGSNRRCQLQIGEHTSAVACEALVHTVTSTTPKDPSRCECIDGTHCVALGQGASAGEGRGLFVFPPDAGGKTLPVGALGITGEDPITRVCARACSGELDCPAGHTCRAAAVLQSALLADPNDTRHTVAVCYPDRLATLTSTSPKQPDPKYCAEPTECPGTEVCQAQAVVIPDHPTAPAGAAWGEHIALVQRCVPRGGMLLTPTGTGCNPDTRCESGICFKAKCAQLCDPTIPEPCGQGRTCLHRNVERPRPGGQTPVVDHIWLCGG